MKLFLCRHYVRFFFFFFLSFRSSLLYRPLSSVSKVNSFVDALAYAAAARTKPKGRIEGRYSRNRTRRCDLTSAETPMKNDIAARLCVRARCFVLCRVSRLLSEVFAE